MTPAPAESQTAVYVYGVLPASVKVQEETRGVGQPPGKLRVVRSDDLAALVSDVDVDRPLGTAEDLRAHKDILDASVGEVPVLPLRFGAVVTDDDAVVGELLGPNHDEFLAALDELDGRCEYVVKGRYAEQAILAEILAEDPELAGLADEIRGADPDATRNLRIELGEKINQAITAKREEDTRRLGDALADICVASVVRDPTHEMDAVHVACLVENDKAAELEHAVGDLDRHWEGRAELRALGPMAAYDFSSTAQGG
jgi:hypothetical protein